MAAPWPQVVLLGDSLFQGASDVQGGFSFQGALQNHCQRRYDVVNRGFSGYNTSQVLKILPDIIPAPHLAGPQLKYLVVLLGANDAALPSPVDNQHVDLDQYKINLRAIVTHPHIVAHKPKILLVTPPPLDEIRLGTIDRANGRGGPSRHAKVSASYSAAARDLAGELAPSGVVLIDLWKELMDVAVAKTPGFYGVGGAMLGDPGCGLCGHLENLLPDGLHMSGEAYQVFYDAVRPHIIPEIATLGDGEGHVLPEWRVAPWS
ncbi:hypothetical protein PspLS_08382 [Pyricularia sp. CBS 133598]|nr:hypothetical protein PspLS_08382 [Pyricularia sp. CBS 133598]